MTKINRYQIGDACLCWSMGDSIDQVISSRVLKIYRILSEKGRKASLGIRDLVPSYNALAVHYDLLNTELDRLTREVDAIVKQVATEQPDPTEVAVLKSARHTIPVVYNGEDLGRVAKLSGLTEAEVIRLHQARDYTVAMIGFLPHFPYLIGLDERLVTSRLDSPRTRIPAGAVAIAGAQAGIYPSESPGGWNLLGLTDPGLLITIEPGDTINFKEVSEL